ncbi:MAG: aminotransferase class III-fold pyridoxal phosphate-dependent enzyme [Bacteroidales bacterium]|nr:aminotransferase class III-fold pyridoxal phosphate-dependent enzyme [Bacteroidales bacterium]
MQCRNKQSDHPNIILDVRGRGLMIGIEFDAKIDLVKIPEQLLKEGIITGYKENVLRFMPPLIIEKEEIDKLIIILGDLLK